MDQLKAGIAEALGARVLELRPLTGGACQELFRVDVELEQGPATFALRSDAASSLPGSVGREIEYPVIEAARAAGVPTPALRTLTRGLVREGAWAYFMDWVEGEAIGARVLRHPSLAEARERLPAQLARALAAVHRVSPQTHDLPLGPPDDPVARGVAFVRDTLDGLPEPHPALELALLWLSERRPSRVEVTLNHGDFRVGNFMVGPEGLVGLLDWEFARWSDPLDDIGWLCVRDWRFGNVKRPAGGLTSRERFCALYTEASGREVPPADLHWWEVLNTLRWAACAVVQGERYLGGSSQDLELLAIPRRVCEMEYEALRLIEVGYSPPAPEAGDSPPAPEAAS